ncbi:MAG: ABC transporter permease [Deltaproteobacteria bacterium]|nr:ABC transporter permease [Deltaproteobacteria bacterium]
MKRIIFLIGCKNLLRNKRRSLLTLCILIFGATGLLLVGGFFENIQEGLREQTIHSQTGHLQINRAGYFEKGASRPAEFYLNQLSDLKNQIDNIPEVSFTLPRLQFTGLATSEKTGISVLALGVDPSLETRMGNFTASNVKHPSTQIIAGQDLDENDPQGVLLGKGLMQSLGLKVGDHLSFITTQENGTIDGMEFQIRGVFETIMKDFNDRVLKMNIKTGQKILGSDDKFQSLLVVLHQTTDTEKIKSHIQNKLGASFEVIPWHQLNHYYKQGDMLLKKIHHIILFIMCIIFLLSIANTMNMTLLERTREFGTMMAMGNPQSTIFSVITFEAIALGFLGATLGVIIGSSIAYIISSIGIEMPPPPQGSTGYTAMMTLTFPLLIQVWLTCFVSTVLASIIPAYRACHFNITEALSY